MLDLRHRLPRRRRLAVRRPAARKATFGFHGVYREIAPPGRVVFTEIFEPFPDVESVVTSLLTEEGRQDPPDRDGALSVALKCATW